LLTGAWGVPRLAAAQVPAGGDAAIVHSVEQRLETAPGVPSYLINITAQNGVVTLRGAVNDVLARDRAGQLAEATAGVSGVRNEVEVRPAERTSWEIERSIDDSLTAAPALSDDQIYADVSDGYVVLTGTVNSWPERRLADLLTEGVPGVRGVDNKLRVAYGARRSDAQIKADIQSRIKWDPRLNTPEIKVAVSNGQVRIAGLVQSAAAQDRIYQDGWVNGVQAVDVTGVRIVPNVRLAMNEAGLIGGAAQAKSGPQTDAQLQIAIVQACHDDPLLSPDHVQVQVEKGVVALKGVVPSREARHAAREIAQEFAGTREVKDMLQVQPAPTAAEGAS
jgi:osmotically-inducible protein OsmY